jgi:hypothetical protein
MGFRRGMADAKLAGYFTNPSVTLPEFAVPKSQLNAAFLNVACFSLALSDWPACFSLALSDWPA